MLEFALCKEGGFGDDHEEKFGVQVGRPIPFRRQPWEEQLMGARHDIEATEITFDQARAELIETRIRNAPPELHEFLRISQRHFDERLAEGDPIDAESIIARCLSGLDFSRQRAV